MAAVAGLDGRRDRDEDLAVGRWRRLAALPRRRPAAAQRSARDYFTGRAAQQRRAAPARPAGRASTTARCSRRSTARTGPAPQALLAQRPTGRSTRSRGPSYYLAASSPRVELPQIEAWLRARPRPAAGRAARPPRADPRRDARCPTCPHARQFYATGGDAQAHPPALGRRRHDAGRGARARSSSGSRNDDPDGARAAARRDRRLAQRRGARRMAPAGGVELLHREPRRRGARRWRATVGAGQRRRGSPKATGRWASPPGGSATATQAGDGVRARRLRRRPIPSCAPPRITGRAAPRCAAASPSAARALLRAAAAARRDALRHARRRAARASRCPSASPRPTSATTTGSGCRRHRQRPRRGRAGRDRPRRAAERGAAAPGADRRARATTPRSRASRAISACPRPSCTWPTTRRAAARPIRPRAIPAPNWVPVDRLAGRSGAGLCPHAAGIELPRRGGQPGARRRG